MGLNWDQLSELIQVSRSRKVKKGTVLFFSNYINCIRGILIIDNVNKREGYKPSPTDKLIDNFNYFNWTKYFVFTLVNTKYLWYNLDRI